MVLSDKVKGYTHICRWEQSYGGNRGVERKWTVTEVPEITFTVSKSKGERPWEAKCKGNLNTVYTAHGIKTARPLVGPCQGTPACRNGSAGRGEPAHWCQERMPRTCKEMPKVAKYSFGADEAVVANIPKREGVMPLQAKGFTWWVLFMYNNLN